MIDECKDCRGTGHNQFDGSRCTTCNGTGTARKINYHPLYHNRFV